MSSSSYKEFVEKHLSDCERYNIAVEDAAFTIMHKAEDFEDEEVVDVFSALPSEIRTNIQSNISDFEKTGEYHVISSTGTSLNLTLLMERLSKLI
ncbi:hypothetical protein [Aliikangiella maris]|uniref:Uncharacterized protein n=2 Tax=Aliikangiella maris TaxID=3162458 RepID=A0ABV3MSW8_9GAMM